jgi:hypothetical protein
MARDAVVAAVDQAYSLFDNGINFLRKNHWQDNYSFSLKIFDLAAKAALASGSTQALRRLTDHVLRQGTIGALRISSMHTSSFCVQRLIHQDHQMQSKRDLQLQYQIGNPLQQTVD